MSCNIDRLSGINPECQSKKLGEQIALIIQQTTVNGKSLTVDFDGGQSLVVAFKSEVDKADFPDWLFEKGSRVLFDTGSSTIELVHRPENINNQ